MGGFFPKLDEKYGDRVGNTTGGDALTLNPTAKIFRIYFLTQTVLYNLCLLKSELKIR